MPGSPLSAPKTVRARWYLQADKYGKSIAEVCAIFGISHKTYYKWRLRDFGPSDHRYRSRKNHPNLKLTPRLKVIAYEAKQRYNYGPAKMRLFLHERYGITVSTTVLYRFFKRRKLIRKPQRKEPWYQPIKEPFRARFPGETVQADVKYVPGGDQTWHYQFRFTDTFTNMQYAIDCLDKSAAAAMYAFRAAKRSFPFPILGLQTDNGSEFRGGFARYLDHCRITQRFIPKRSAPWNGKVERANRSIDDEYYLNPTRPWQTVAAYTHWYNHERYHLGRHMHGLTPYQKLREYLSQQPKVSPLNVN